MIGTDSLSDAENKAKYPLRVTNRVMPQTDVEYEGKNKLMIDQRYGQTDVEEISRLGDGKAHPKGNSTALYYDSSVPDMNKTKKGPRSISTVGGENLNMMYTPEMDLQKMS